MKANEFVKKFGWEEAKNIVDASEIIGIDRNIVDINQLKRLVESHDLVEKYKNRHGGIRFRIRWGMFRYKDTQEFNDRLKQAIADVGSCYD